MKLFYGSCGVIVRLIRHQCFREFVLDGHRMHQFPGGFVLAVTHISHLEPPLLGCHTRRHISWVARKEFFRLPVYGRILKLAGMISIDRFGVPVRAIRQSVARAAAGEVVGIFPEGGVQRGADAVFRNGVMKRGVCVIARRANVPIVPVVMLGTEKLNAVKPYLPWRRARLYVAYGEPVWAVEGETNRDSREATAEVLQAEFVRTYQRLLKATGFKDSDVP